MRRQKSAILLISFVVLVTSLFVAPVLGSQNGPIQQYQITNTGNNQVYQNVNYKSGLNQAGAPILAGNDITISFKIVINAGTGADLKISTSMDHSNQKQVYWEVVGTYAGLDKSSINPNQNFLNFKQTSGELQLICYGFLPTTLTQKTVEGITLHTKATPTVISLSGSGGVLDQIVIDVIDDKISTFNNLFNNAKNNIASLKGVDNAYISLCTTVLNNAKAGADQGFVDNAIGIVNSISSLHPATIETPILATLFIPVVIVMAVVTIAAVFLFMRNRGKSTYYSLVIEDQIKNLEGLTMRAARIDRSLAANLEGIKERLQQIIGT